MKTLEADPPPIACTLGVGEIAQRMRWIAALNAASLRCQSRDDLRLNLSYAPDARAQVTELVRREQECCAFLTFTVREDAAGVHLLIQPPEAAREAADTVFDRSCRGRSTRLVAAAAPGTPHDRFPPTVSNWRSAPRSGRDSSGRDRRRRLQRVLRTALRLAGRRSGEQRRGPGAVCRVLELAGDHRDPRGGRRMALGSVAELPVTPTARLDDDHRAWNRHDVYGGRIGLAVHRACRVGSCPQPVTLQERVSSSAYWRQTLPFSRVALGCWNDARLRQPRRRKRRPA